MTLINHCGTSFSLPICMLGQRFFPSLLTKRRKKFKNQIRENYFIQVFSHFPPLNRKQFLFHAIDKYKVHLLNCI